MVRAGAGCRLERSMTTGARFGQSAVPDCAHKGSAKITGSSDQVRFSLNCGIRPPYVLIGSFTQHSLQLSLKWIANRVRPCCMQLLIEASQSYKLGFVPTRGVHATEQEAAPHLDPRRVQPNCAAGSR